MRFTEMRCTPYPGAVHSGHLIFKPPHTSVSCASTTACSEQGHDRSHKERARLQKKGAQTLDPVRVQLEWAMHDA